MLEAQELSRSFGPVRAVEGVSFSIGRGELVGLLGPNGAGKTTTIRVLTGYLPPTAGRARVDGLDTVDDSRAARGRVGYLPESNPLYPEMRVEDYLRHRAALHGVPRASRGASVDGAIERCWLRDVRRRRIGHLSKGFRQRVGLAAALVHDPPALILDEPTSGLDPTQIVETRRFLRDLAGERTLLLSSHILSEVERTCDRIIVMARGRVRADGDPATIARASDTGGDYIVECARVDAAPAQSTDVPTVFQRILGVQGAAVERREGRWTRIRVTPAPNAPDLREALAHAAAGAGLAVRELRREGGSLEAAFARLVERADEPAGGGA